MIDVVGSTTVDASFVPVAWNVSQWTHNSSWDCTHSGGIVHRWTSVQGGAVLFEAMNRTRLWGFWNYIEGCRMPKDTDRQIDGLSSTRADRWTAINPFLIVLAYSILSSQSQIVLWRPHRLCRSKDRLWFPAALSTPGQASWDSRVRSYSMDGRRQSRPVSEAQTSGIIVSSYSWRNL